MQTPSWTNQNSYRVYPFIEDTQPTVNGNALNTAAILDAKILVHQPGVEPVSAGLVSLFVAHSGNLTLRVEVTGVPQFVLSIPNNATYPYTVIATNSMANLRMVFGPGMEELREIGYGLYAAVGTFEPTLVQFQPNHRVLSLLGDADGSEVITGDIYIKEGHGVAVAVTPETSRVQLNGYPGAGAGFACDELPKPYVDLTLVDVDTQPDGCITLDHVDFCFGDPPPDPGSGGSGELDLTVYVPLGMTPTDTFTNLQTALSTNLTGVTITMETSESDTPMLHLVRDESLVYNAQETATNITLSKQSMSDLDCNNVAISINDVTPDGYGNMQLVGGNGIAISNDPDNHTIYVSNRYNVDDAGCGTCREEA